MQTQHKIQRVLSANASQLQAIETTECPLLIIAEPGSGKTYTLVERVYHLIADKRIQPENILISTFREKAAREIRDFKSEAKPDVTDVQSYQRYQKQLETYAHIRRTARLACLPDASLLHSRRQWQSIDQL